MSLGAQGTPQPMPYAGPTPGKGRLLMATEFNAGILIVEILVVMGLGYIMVIGMASLAVNHDFGSALMAFIPMAILLPIVLVMSNSGGVYENGVKVSRPLFMRLMGKKIFFRYEEVKAFYPAEYVTSAQMMEPRGTSYHTYRPGYVNVSAFGEAYGSMLSDSGSRTSVGMATDEGEFILKPVTTFSNQSTFTTMMDYIRWAMGVRNLPMVRVPLELSSLELESLTVDSHGMSFRWYAIVSALAIGIPFIPLIIG